MIGPRVMTERRYSQDEVDAILGRAIERQHRRGELSHEDLVAAAHEIGVSSDAIEKAATEVLVERQQRDQLAMLRRQQWRGFFRHLVPFVFVNGMLVTLNLLTTHFPWALFPLFGWGIGLFCHFMAVAFPSRQRLERILERQRNRERRQQLKRQIRTNASQLEQDVGRGISALLEAAAQRIAGGPPADVDRYSRARVEDASSARPDDQGPSGPDSAATEGKWQREKGRP